MKSVFISYAKEDAASARMLADALQRVGFSVWWDRRIPPGKTWDDVIGRALDAAACAIVMWSTTSIQSRWVREEAEKAASRGCLIPVLVDKVDPPFGFGRIQAADLSGWRGDGNDPEFADLLRAVSDLVQATPDRSASDQRACERVNLAPEPHRERSKFLWIAASLIAVAVTFYIASQFARAPRPEPESAPPTKAALPIKAAPPIKIGEPHKFCVDFADPEPVVSRGPITKIIVFHSGYVTAIGIQYGTDGFGEIHGFQYGTEFSWTVPDGERITLVKGELAPASGQGKGCAPQEYVSQLQFFTDRGTESPLFGTARGKPFVVRGALRTISGSANSTRYSCFNRAVASMTFLFGVP